MLNKILAIVTALLIGSISGEVLGADDGYKRVDTCVGYEDFVKLCTPADGMVMPQFCGVPKKVASPGPLPNGAVILPRVTKCWVWSQLTLTEYYPALAEKILDEILAEQASIYEERLEAANQFRWAMPIAVGSTGILIGAFLTFLIVK